MRKLTDIEMSALRALRKFGAYTPGKTWVHVPSFEAEAFRTALDSLVKKKRVRASDTDDGPRYTLTAQGEADAA